MRSSLFGAEERLVWAAQVRWPMWRREELYLGWSRHLTFSLCPLPHTPPCSVASCLALPTSFVSPLRALPCPQGSLCAMLCCPALPASSWGLHGCLTPPPGAPLHGRPAAVLGQGVHLSSPRASGSALVIASWGCPCPTSKPSLAI